MHTEKSQERKAQKEGEGVILKGKTNFVE